MKVCELIELLKKQPQDIQVAYPIHSEYCLLEEKDIGIADLCEPRPDGWIADRRNDKNMQTYLVIG